MARLRGTTIEQWLSDNRYLLIALVGTFAFHGVILFSGSYRGTYDAYVHMFFADHYARGWWDLWEPRWYTGFTTVSYPPLSHQTTALLSKVFSIPTGFTLVMLVASVNATLGVYRFSRLWVAERPAGYAALLAVFSSSFAETIHVFGQLPTMFVIGVILNALPYLWRWLEDGTPGDLVRSWSLLMVACGGHHVTTIFGMVFFSGPIFATVLWHKFRSPRLAEPISPETISLSTLPRLVIRRVRRVLPTFWRSFAFGMVFILIAVTTVMPYWIWSRGDPITQITIPHGSRLNFITNPNIGLMFFIIPWGMMLFLLPYAVVRGLTSRSWIITTSLMLLSLLGTGGTTPIPAILLGGAFYILTLDRFTFWASIIILPLAGEFIESVLHGAIGGWLKQVLGNWSRYALIGGLAASMIVVAIFVANLTQFRRFQPDPLDMTPIVEFLSKDDHDKWRYMTLGFGDQLAWLSAQTTALNVEGNYHSARRLPEMTSTPIERLDGAKFQAIPGLGSLHQFVGYPQRYNLKYIFVNDAFYEPLLHFSGWVRLGNLENDVQVWERADVSPLPVAIPEQDYPDWQRLMWGVLPISSLGIATLVFLFVPRGLPAFDALNTGPMQTSEWLAWQRAIRQFLLRFVPPIWLQRVLMGVVVLGILGGGGFLYLTSPVSVLQSPEDVVLDYYDALDFGRFAESYRYLQTDLSEDEYLRYLSLRGGLVASFSKLENLFIEVETRGNDNATAHVRAEWLTSLGTYPQVVTYDLVRDGLTWRILFEAAPPPLPRETLTVTTETDFFINTPLVDLAEGALNRGTLTRSQLSVSPIKVMYVPDVPISFLPEVFERDRIEGRFDGLISVLGEVTNRDFYPAHITVTVALRGGDGDLLARTNALDVIQHQLLPGETTPFRVDFGGVYARDILQISDIQSVEVIVQGVPTSANLERPLSVIGPGTVYNGTSQQVDIPALLVKYDDWVERVYLERAIAPDKTGAFELPEPPPNRTPLPILISVDGPKLVPWEVPQPYELVLDGYIR